MDESSEKEGNNSDDVEAVICACLLERCLLSNTELALLSNLNRRWRSAVRRVLLSDDGTPSDLLLPSILRQLRNEAVAGGDDAPHANGQSPSNPTVTDTFCVAWFAEEGIQHLPVSMVDPLEDNPRGRYYYDDDRNQQSRMRQRSRVSAALERRNRTTVCNEWKGYETAWDVLRHFNYNTSFVKDIMAMATKIGSHTNTSKQQPKGATTAAVRGATMARPESYCFCLDAHNDHPRILDLQRDVLPRIIRTAARRPAVQCLNASGSHAVCLFTPEFACGPLPEPLTIIVVGVATEDGCFISGLQRRFELGHMYPADEIAEATELSAICLGTDRNVDPIITRGSHGVNNDDSTCSDDVTVDDSDDDRRVNDDMHSDVDRIFLPNGKCGCAFKGICQKQCPVLPDDDEEDEEDEDKLRIHRGKTGPGAWHCYTAIADGKSSVVRVDGTVESEAMLTETGATALLDGLTIGSDHCFDLSLCCGGGSGSAGQGAIAEIAVFSGRLDESDLRELEKKMMVKYCIKKTWSDCERQAQALFLRKELPGRVPLRYMTRNAAVAWKLLHPVTAEPIMVSRIGSHAAGASSSEF